MKYIYLLSVLILLLSACTAIETEETVEDTSSLQENRLRHNLEAYRLAVAMGDYQSALPFIYEIMADDSATDQWYDTLAEYYVQLNMVAAADRLSEMRLGSDPDNEKMAELRMRSLLGTRRPEEAVAVAQSLIGRSDKIKYYFTLAEIYLQTGQEDAYDSTLLAIRNNPQFDTASLQMQDARVAEGQQRVPATAVVEYMEAVKAFSAGQGAYQQGNVAVTRRMWREALAGAKKALQLYPDFFSATELKSQLERGLASLPS